jgi:hypothetical protein
LLIPTWVRSSPIAGPFFFVRAPGFFISRLYLPEFGLFPTSSSLPPWCWCWRWRAPRPCVFSPLFCPLFVSATLRLRLSLSLSLLKPCLFGHFLSLTSALRLLAGCWLLRCGLQVLLRLWAPLVAGRRSLACLLACLLAAGSWQLLAAAGSTGSWQLAGRPSYWPAPGSWQLAALVALGLGLSLSLSPGPGHCRRLQAAAARCGCGMRMRHAACGMPLAAGGRGRGRGRGRAGNWELGSREGEEGERKERGRPVRLWYYAPPASWPLGV